MWTTVKKRDLISQMKKYREKEEMPLEKMAQLIGVSFTTICRWENGKCLPHDIVADRILEAIGGMR